MDAIVPDIDNDAQQEQLHDEPKSLLDSLIAASAYPKRFSVLTRYARAISDIVIAEHGVCVLVLPSTYASTVLGHSGSLIPVILIADTPLFDAFADQHTAQTLPKALVVGHPKLLFYRVFLLRLLELAGVRVPMRAAVATLRALYNHYPIALQTFTRVTLVPFHILQEVDAVLTDHNSQLEPMALATLSELHFPMVPGLTPLELLWSIACTRGTLNIALHYSFRFDNCQTRHYPVIDPRDTLVAHIIQQLSPPV